MNLENAGEEMIASDQESQSAYRLVVDYAAIMRTSHHQAKHTRTPDVRFGSMSIKSAAIFPPEISICGDSSCETHDTEGRLEIAGRSLSATGLAISLRVTE